jgi:uncharacterized membrane protein YfhO
MSKISKKKQLINMNRFKPSNPMPAIKEFFIEKPHIWLSFAIPFAIMFAAYMYFDIWPSGERSVLALDFNAQYVYYFIYMRDALFGAEDILYSWSRNLSGEFVGIIGYYVFSPFNLIVWVFPLSHITEGLMLMILTKIGFIGVTMSIYLSYSRGFSKHTTVAFSIMYALLSFNIVQTMNPMWLDGVMALPLVIMGIESLMKNGKYKLLIFSLVYSFVTCFYIGYMIAIFAAMYFIYYSLTSRKYSDRDWADISIAFVSMAWYIWYAVEVLKVFTNTEYEGGFVPHIVTVLLVLGNMGYFIRRYLTGSDAIRLLMRKIGLFGIAAVLAVMISAIMLLPVYSALSLGKFEFSNPDYSIRSNFDILNITKKLFLNSYDTVRMPEGMPFLFSGTLALIMLPVYFFCDRIRRARRFGGVIMITALVVSMMIVPLDMFWHGLQNPNWLPYRYSFMLCFLIIAFGAEAFEHIRKVSHRTIGLSAAFFGALLIWWQYQNTRVSTLGGAEVLKEGGRDVFDSLGTVLPALGAVIVFASIVILARDRLNKHNMFTCILIAAVALELMYNTQYSLEKQHVDIFYSDRASFNSMLVTREKMDEIIANDSGFWRSEKQYIRSACDTMAVRMKGVTHSSSMLNARAIKILKDLGYSARSHASRYSGNTPLTDDLFGFKYILSLADGSRSPSATNPETVDNIIVTVNEDHLPIAYLVDMKMQGLTLVDGEVFDNQNKLLSRMLANLADTTSQISTDLLNLRPVQGQYSIFTNKGETTSEGEPRPAHIEYIFNVEESGNFYAYFDSEFDSNYEIFVTQYETESVVYALQADAPANGEPGDTPAADNTPAPIASVFTQSSSAHYLGYFEEGETYIVRYTLYDSSVFFKSVRFMRAVDPAIDAIAGTNNHDAVLPMILDDGSSAFERVHPNSERATNLENTADGLTVYVKQNQSEQAQVNYYLYAQRGGDYFINLPGNYTRMYDIYVDGEYVPQYYDPANNHVYYLGHFNTGDYFEVALVLRSNEIFFRSERFARVERDNLAFEGDARTRYYSRLLNNLRANDREKFFTPVETSERLNNVNAALMSDEVHTQYQRTNQGDAAIEYTFTADGDGEFYAYFPTDYNQNYSLMVNGLRPEAVFENDRSVHFLGRFSRGDLVSVVLLPTEDTIFFKQAIFVRNLQDFRGDAIMRNSRRAFNLLQGGEFNNYFSRLEYSERKTLNLREETMGHNYTGFRRLEGSSGDAHIEYFLQADADGDVYMYFPSNYERSCNLWVLRLDGSHSPQSIGQMYNTDHHHIHYLGFFKRGENFKVTVSLQGSVNDVFFREEYFVRLDRDLLEADVARVHQMNENSTFDAVNNRHLRVTTNNTSTMMLFTSIPNEPGWRVTINGKKVDIDEVAGGLIAVMVPAGENTIELKFFPHRMRLGILLTLAGIAGLIFLNYLMKRHEQKEAALAARARGSKKKKTASAIIATRVKDEYDGFDPDYVNIDLEDDDFDFIERVEKVDDDDSDN